MSFVAIDLGASSSRLTETSGKIKILPNNMVMFRDETPSLITPDSDGIESCLEVQITKESGNPCEHFPANCLIGIMAERHSSANERPSAETFKYLQRVNYISILTACAFSRLTSGTGEDINLYLDVPPLQIHTAREVFGQTLLGSYRVFFPKYMGGTSVKVNIKSVDIYEESYMALTSFFFNMNGTIKDNNKKLLGGTVLSIDIGASTSDFSIAKMGRYLDKSGQTYMIGGNEARDALSDLVRMEYAIELPVEAAEKAMAEGRLQLGNTFEDISHLVAQAKTALAKKLIHNLPNYFKKVDIPLQMINAIVVSGGGSMQSQYINDDGEVVKTCESLSYFVTEQLTNLSRGTLVVEYGEEARLANIKGLYIKAKMDEAHRQKETTATVAAQATPVAPQATPVAPAPQVAPQATPVAPQVVPQVAPAPVTPSPVAPTPVAPQATPVAPVPVVTL